MRPSMSSASVSQTPRRRLVLSSTEFFHSHSLRMVPTQSDERPVRVNRTARLTLRAVTQAEFPDTP